MLEAYIYMYIFIKIRVHIITDRQPSNSNAHVSLGMKSLRWIHIETCMLHESAGALGRA